MLVEEVFHRAYPFPQKSVEKSPKKCLAFVLGSDIVSMYSMVMDSDHQPANPGRKRRHSFFRENTVREKKILEPLERVEPISAKIDRRAQSERRRFSRLSKESSRSRPRSIGGRTCRDLARNLGPKPRESSAGAPSVASVSNGKASAPERNLASNRRGPESGLKNREGRKSILVRGSSR